MDSNMPEMVFSHTPWLEFSKYLIKAPGVSYHNLKSLDQATVSQIVT